MKPPTAFHYSALAIFLGVAAVLWFSSDAGKTPAPQAEAASSGKLRAKHSNTTSSAEARDAIQGKPRPRDANPAAPGVKVVRLAPDRVIATVNQQPIQLCHLMPVAEGDAENSLTPEEYNSRLQRAIDTEVILQAAKAAGVELTEAQQKRRDDLAASTQAELDHYRKHGLTWSTTGPQQVEFEQRLLSARMLEQNLVAKSASLTPSPDPAVQSRYELARLDLLKQLHASAQVAIAGPK